MTKYRTVLVGNVTDRWTKRGQQEEMDLLSEALTDEAEGGWKLHSLQPVPLFGGFSQKQTGVLLLAIFEHD